MPTRLTTYAVEQSTFAITADMTDENGQAMTPLSLVWTLTDAAGNIINDRDAVAVTGLASQVNILLSGDDLALQSTEKVGARILTLEGTYTSAVNGATVPFKDSVLFRVQGLVAVT